MEPTCEGCPLAFGLNTLASVDTCSALAQLRHQKEYGGSEIDAKGKRVTCPLEQDNLERYAERTKELMNCPIHSKIVAEINKIMAEA